MSNAPHFEIDLDEFWMNPYPILSKMRENFPLAYVPQLDAVLMTRRKDIFENEKLIDVFSSFQPEGLMVKLMGNNMMRKDGQEHLKERKAIFPSISPKTVKNIWKKKFEKTTDEIIEKLLDKDGGDLLKEFGIPVSAEALKVVTGLTNMTFSEMDKVSQGMIDGIANYTNNPKIFDNCNLCTELIDKKIDEMIPKLIKNENFSLLSVQLQSGLDNKQIKANIKLAISGGQNEPRDALAGTVWALLSNPKQLKKVKNKKRSWVDAFEEYSRWIAPVGMSPRRIAKKFNLNGITLEPEDKVFFMFGSANRDEEYFINPKSFDLDQDRSASIAFGAGPHFCAGAWISKCLIGEVALPKLFERLPNIKLDETKKVIFGGWAFRGPLSVFCKW